MTATAHQETRTASTPVGVADELAYELMRDEWDLLLAIGSGPRTAAQVAKDLGATKPAIERRAALLMRHGLVQQSGDGYSLVPAFFDRREGMSSFVRDLVMRCLESEAPPVAGRVRDGMAKAELVALNARLRTDAVAAVSAVANRPESEHAERFVLVCASAEVKKKSGTDRSLKSDLLEVLRAAATARSLEPNAPHAFLWMSEMRVDPEVALEIGEIFERFVDGQPSQTPGDGRAAFVILPASRRR